MYSGYLGGTFLTWTLTWTLSESSSKLSCTYVILWLKVFILWTQTSTWHGVLLSPQTILEHKILFLQISKLLGVSPELTRLLQAHIQYPINIYRCTLDYCNLHKDQNTIQSNHSLKERASNINRRQKRSSKWWLRAQQKKTPRRWWTTTLSISTGPTATTTLPQPEDPSGNELPTPAFPLSPLTVPTAVAVAKWRHVCWTATRSHPSPRIHSWDEHACPGFSLPPSSSHRPGPVVVGSLGSNLV